jgi:uncharacterized integral membrane protein (TIGR00698 family)
LTRLPGLALATAIAAVATGFGKFFPIIGGPVTGIIIGVALAAAIKPGARLKPGITYSSKSVLQTSVVLLGTQLSLTQIVHVGGSSLPVMLGSLTVCLVSAYWIGRWLGIIGDLRTLIGVGTGICGASAIAAVTPVIGAGSVEVAYAMSTIFMFNIAAVLAFPLIGHLLGLSQHAFGLFAGTAVNDMSSVVATATTYGDAAINYAVVVKLTRTLLIIPICLGLTALVARRARYNGRRAAAADGIPTASIRSSTRATIARAGRLVPWFLIGFLILATVNSFGLIPQGAHPGLTEVSMFLITIALSAIGLSTDIVGLRRTGYRPLVLGASLWVIVSLTSLGLQFVTGTL